MEVKKRIGYLPETPPLYPEMEVVEYLDFVGRAQRRAPGPNLRERIDDVMRTLRRRRRPQEADRQASKGYRQRVGLAQAIIHNPDVLILDEPTAGLDPKQINETRDLIKGLAGDHTIILSTHILPEVEQTCEQVIIINKGKLVATDSVRNLTNRPAAAKRCWWKWRAAMAASETVGGSAPAGAGGRRQPRAVRKSRRHERAVFEVESRKDALRSRRPGARRRRIWLGSERTAARCMSLEEVFLQLTGERSTGSETRSRRRGGAS